MKIYTKRGDTGATDLIGERVSKDDLRIELIGAIDELNAAIGTLVLFASRDHQKLLEKIQHWLFCYGALAANSKNIIHIELPTDAISQLERAIDTMTEKLPEIREFLLPRGSTATCAAHTARAICRRAERATVRAKVAALTDTLLPFLNRLSDYLFTVARYESIGEASETPWRKSGTIRAYGKPHSSSRYSKSRGHR